VRAGIVNKARTGLCSFVLFLSPGALARGDVAPRANLQKKVKSSS
jgi:hypothetical protein